MRHYFLGAAAGYKVGVFRQLFVHGIEADRRALSSYLARRYQGSEAILTKNGRSALCLALMANFEKGDRVIVNGFTCYAVVEAVLAAGLVPVYADISAETLNFTPETLEKALSRTGLALAVSPTSQSSVGSSPARSPVRDEGVRGIIVQNTLGIPVDIGAVERFAKNHNLVIIEDLAHSAGVVYSDGREAGTVGAAAVLSFGKEKMVDTISGGAAIFRNAGIRMPSSSDTLKGARPSLRSSEDGIANVPSQHPLVSDTLRARFYPLFMAIYRGLSHVHLAGPFMRCLLKIHWVERSADSKLDVTRKISKFEARLALEQLKGLKKSGKKPLRTFVLLENRDEVLKKLRANGYYFGGFWYEKPVSPARYYKKVHFPELECPVATEVAAKIINFPTYYTSKELAPAMKIVRETGAICAKEARRKVPMGDMKQARTKVPTTGVKRVNGARKKVPTKRRLVQ